MHAFSRVLGSAIRNGVSRGPSISIFRAVASTVTALLVMAGAGLVATVSGASAQAAPVYGNGPNGNFWTVPAVPTGAANGQLLYYSLQVTSQLNSATVWTVAYVSTDANGNQLVVTGTVAVPWAAWTGRGARPIIDYAVGTQGMDQTCAPSRQWFTNFPGFEYEDANINADLSAGYTVIVTDYEWAGTTNTPPATYMVALAEGHAVLDMAKAALELPGAGLTDADPVIVAGYSQGGGGALEAGEQWPTYAPSVHLVGVSAGGVPGNLPAVQAASNGALSAGFGLAFMSLMGFHSAYPALPSTSLLNSAGASLVTAMEQQCVGTALLDYENQVLSTYTTGGITYEQLVAMGTGFPTWRRTAPACLAPTWTSRCSTTRAAMTTSSRLPWRTRRTPTCAPPARWCSR